jgi:hypothetical protein
VSMNLPCSQTKCCGWDKLQQEYSYCWNDRQILEWVTRNTSNIFCFFSCWITVNQYCLTF